MANLCDNGAIFALGSYTSIDLYICMSYVYAPRCVGEVLTILVLWEIHPRVQCLASSYRQFQCVNPIRKQSLKDSRLVYTVHFMQLFSTMHVALQVPSRDRYMHERQRMTDNT